MNKLVNVMTIESRIIEASNAYYMGNPIMSDSEFDELVDQLKILNPNSQILEKIGAEVSSSPWPIINHKRPMGSLHKINNKMDFMKWAIKYTGGLVCISDKIDGLSISLEYDGGNLIQGLTRGDGIKGEDITNNLKKLKGVLSSVTDESHFVVRGEAVLFTEDYNKHFPRKVLDDGTVENSNARNCAAVIRRKKNNSDIKHVTFVAYDIHNIYPETRPMSKETIFDTLHTMGFIVPFYKVAEISRAWSIFESYQQSLRSKRPYEIDGLVVEEDNTSLFAQRGESSGRPRAARALKFIADSGRSTIRDIVWQVGRTGNVTPVAKIDPVVIGGVTINSPSLMSVAECVRLGIYKGSNIIVERCNDVIPRITSSENNSMDAFVIPHKVDGYSVCLKVEDKMIELKSDLRLDKEALKELGADIDTCSSIILYCNDPDHPTRRFRRFENFTKTLDIKGIGEKTIEQLIKLKLIDSLPDFFKLSIHDWEAATGSPLLAKKAKKELNDKTQGVPLPIFIKSLGITFFGEDTAKLIEAEFPNLDDWFNLTLEQITAIKGIGESKAQAAIDGLKNHDLEIQKLKNYIKIGEPETVIDNSTTVCFTGVRLPPVWYPAFKSKGYREVSGVSKKTQILVVMDADSNSGKSKKAREYGTKIVSYDEFLRGLR